MRTSTIRYALLSAVVLALGSSGPSVGQGARDTGTVVSGLSVIAQRSVPIPNVGQGAAALSSEQLESLVCKARSRMSPGVRFGGGRAGGSRLEASATWATAQRAHAATEAAETVRLEAARGQRTKAEVEQSELARQTAVQAYYNQYLTEMQLAHPNILLGRNLTDPGALFAELQAIQDTGRLDGRLDAVEELALAQELTPITGFAIEGVTARYVQDRRGEALLVEGALRNLRDRAAGVPSLQVTMIDKAGFALEIEHADPGGGRIKPGEAQRFSYRMAKPPAFAFTVRVEATTRPQHTAWRSTPDLRCDRRG